MSDRFISEWSSPYETLFTAKAQASYEEAEAYARTHADGWNYSIYRLQPVTKKTTYKIKVTYSLRENREIMKDSLEACMIFMRAKLEALLGLTSLQYIHIEDNLKSITIKWRDGQTDTYEVVEETGVVND